MSNSAPFRDPNEAAHQRLQALVAHEDANRTKPRKKSYVALATVIALLSALLLGLVGLAAVVVYTLGKPLQKTVVATSAGVSVTVIFRTDVRDVVAHAKDGSVLTPLMLPATEMDGTPRPVRAVSYLIPMTEPTEITLEYRAFGFTRHSEIPVSPLAESTVSARGILEGMPNSWVAFINGNLYFSTLLAYKYALKEIRWGVNDEPLDRRVAFAQTNSPSQGIDIATDTVYLPIPATVQKVRVELVWKDGTKSAVRSISRSAASH